MINSLNALKSIHFDSLKFPFTNTNSTDYQGCFCIVYETHFLVAIDNTFQIPAKFDAVPSSLSL